MWGDMVKWTTLLENRSLGDDETLSNLVCGLKDFHDCVNPRHKRGHIYGDKDTWEKRAGKLRQITKEIEDAEGTDYQI